MNTVNTTLQTCCSDHQEIKFYGEICPLCDANRKMRDLAQRLSRATRRNNLEIDGMRQESIDDDRR